MVGRNPGITMLYMARYLLEALQHLFVSFPSLLRAYRQAAYNFKVSSAGGWMDGCGRRIDVLRRRTKKSFRPRILDRRQGGRSTKQLYIFMPPYLVT
jgi:hypothetical protein